ncbi:putative conserved protein, partial [Dysosmobacter welbionis]
GSRLGPHRHLRPRQLHRPGGRRDAGQHGNHILHHRRVLRLCRDHPHPAHGPGSPGRGPDGVSGLRLRGAAVLRRLMGRRPAPSSCAEIRLQHSGAAVGGGELTVHQIPHLFHCPQGQQGVRQCPEGQGQIRLLRQTRQSRRGQVYI